MLITCSNINEPKTLEWFFNFVKIVKIIINDDCIIYGSIVYNYLIPCYYFACDWTKYSSLKKVVEHFGQIDFKKIDISIDFIEDSDDDDDDDDDGTVRRNKRCVPPILQDIIDELLGSGICYRPITILTDIQIQFKLEIINCCTANKLSYNVLCYNREFLPFKCNFTIDNIYFDNKLDILSPHMETFVKWAINIVPKLSIQNIDCSQSQSIVHVPAIHDAILSYVINECMERKTTWIKNKFKEDDYQNITDDIKNVIHESKFEITSNPYCSVSLENDDHGDDCSICKDAFENKELIMTTECNHTFHYKCMSKWIFSTIIIVREDNVPSCPNCRTLLHNL